MPHVIALDSPSCEVSGSGNGYRRLWKVFRDAPKTNRHLVDSLYCSDIISSDGYNFSNKPLLLTTTTTLITRRSSPRPRRFHCSRPWMAQLAGLFPSVHAAEVPEGQAGDLSISEKVSQSRPKLHISDEEVERVLAMETGRDRLRQMFKTEGENLSSELQLVWDVTQTCAYITFVFTSFFGGFKGRDDFIREHQHTKFPTRFKAMRAYNDAIFIGGLKFGALWGLKAGVFTGIFMAVSQSVAVYRNKSSPLEYFLGGAFTGSLLRINLGLKGYVAGGIIGGFMGLCTGLVMYAGLKLGNETQEQRHYWQIYEKLRNDREVELLKPALAKDAEKTAQVAV